MVECIDNGSAASVEYVRNTVIAASYNNPGPFSESYLGRQASVGTISLSRGNGALVRTY